MLREVPRSEAVANAVEKKDGLRDADLVARCCDGDSHAWRALYDRHFSAVFRFVSALGVQAEEREDAVQEVFVAVYKSLPGFRGEAQLSTWIYRIAARHALRLSRRRRVRDLLGVLLARDVRPEPQPDPVERSSDLALLDTLLARLAPKKRTALVLFEIEGLSVDEIAQVVGCPVNTVWSRLHHARRELGQHARKLAKLEKTSGEGVGGGARTIALTLRDRDVDADDRGSA